MTDKLTVEQRHIDAANTFILSLIEGGVDGSAYVVRPPSVTEVQEAFARFEASLTPPVVDTPDTVGMRELSWAYTPATGAWKHYPPFINLSVRDGKFHVIVRGPEVPHPDNAEWLDTGPWAEFDLPFEALVDLSAALSTTPTGDTT